MSKSDELQKPVRRSDKKILNELMKLIKFPLQKTRVQDPWHKSYILMQTAIAKNHISEFSLKVEQSEIVEQCIRILSLLHHYCQIKLLGNLLYMCCLLQRSLTLRIWCHGCYETVFAQCPHVAKTTVDRLIMSNIREFDDIWKYEKFNLQSMLHCCSEEILQIYAFARSVQSQQLFAQVAVSEYSIERKLLVTISPHASNSVLGRDEKCESIAPLRFVIICFYLDTKDLICFRSFVFSSYEQIYHISCPAVNSELKYECPSGFKSAHNNSNVGVALLCLDVVGIDFISFDNPSASNSVNATVRSSNSMFIKSNIVEANKKDRSELSEIRHVDNVLNDIDKTTSVRQSRGIEPKNCLDMGSPQSTMFSRLEECSGSYRRMSDKSGLLSFLGDSDKHPYATNAQGESAVIRHRPRCDENVIIELKSNSNSNRPVHSPSNVALDLLRRKAKECNLTLTGAKLSRARDQLAFFDIDCNKKQKFTNDVQDFGGEDEATTETKSSEINFFSPIENVSNKLLLTTSPIQDEFSMQPSISTQADFGQRTSCIPSSNSFEDAKRHPSISSETIVTKNQLKPKWLASLYDAAFF